MFALWLVRIQTKFYNWLYNGGVDHAIERPEELATDFAAKIPGAMKTIVRRQDAPQCFDMNPSIYAWWREPLLNNDHVIQSGTGLYLMPEERSVDIDSELDFRGVDFLMNDQQKYTQ